MSYKKIFNSNELDVNSTTEKISVVQTEGDREVNRTMTFYNLDAVISVDYRVNSLRATQFRQWTTNIIRQFAIRGYVIDKKRMENGSFIGQDYFEHLLAEIKKNITFYSFRHTCATMLVTAGVDINTVSRHMTHSSIITTQQYFHMVNDKLSRLLKR